MFWNGLLEEKYQILNTFSSSFLPILVYKNLQSDINATLTKFFRKRAFGLSIVYAFNKCYTYSLKNSFFFVLSKLSVNEITKSDTHVRVSISLTIHSNDGHYYGQIKRIPIDKIHVYVDIHCTCSTCTSFTLVSLVLIDVWIT